MRVFILSAIAASAIATLGSLAPVGLTTFSSDAAHAQRAGAAGPPPFKRCLRRCMSKGHNEYACRNRCIRK
jgi:hypothetical protein